MSRFVQHQQQPCPVSCMSTCLAMVANLPVDNVIDQFHMRYREGGLSIRQMLDEMKIPFMSFDSADNTNLDYVGAYLCTVPSLNIIGGTHAIVIEVTEDDYFVLDPVMGRVDRKFYVKRGDDMELAVELGGFEINAFVCTSWLKARP